MTSETPRERRKLKQVLVVEDDLEIRESLAELLRLDGYGVTTAGNGYQALSVLKEMETLPALIILDILMPEMDGLEFLRKRQGEARLKSIPTVVLTCNETNEASAMKLGANSFLQKPVEAEHLLQSARKLCQEKA